MSIGLVCLQQSPIHPQEANWASVERPIRPYVRLEPLPSSSSDSSWTSPTTVPRRPTSTQPIAPRRNLAFDGTLARTLPLLQPGAEANHTVGVLFLASGNYSFRAAVEEVDLAATSEDPPNIRFSPILHVDVSS